MISSAANKFVNTNTFRSTTSEKLDVSLTSKLQVAVRKCFDSVFQIKTPNKRG